MMNRSMASQVPPNSKTNDMFGLNSVTKDLGMADFADAQGVGHTQYGYLNTFDREDNYKKADRVVRQHLNYASTEHIDKAVKYAAQYLVKELPEWLLSKYIDTLERLVNIASMYSITLQPERIYYDNQGRLDHRRMIDAIKEIFPYGDRHGRSMTVNEFQEFVSSELP